MEFQVRQAASYCLMFPKSALGRADFFTPAGLMRLNWYPAIAHIQAELLLYI